VGETSDKRVFAAAWRARQNDNFCGLAQLGEHFDLLSVDHVYGSLLQGGWRVFFSPKLPALCFIRAADWGHFCRRVVSPFEWTLWNLARTAHQIALRGRTSICYVFLLRCRFLIFSAILRWALCSVVLGTIGQPFLYEWLPWILGGLSCSSFQHFHMCSLLVRRLGKSTVRWFVTKGEFYWFTQIQPN
jgi:hypothetical protein